MFEISTIIVILGTFLIGGLVKGVIGWGLPSISLAILTVFTNLPTSIVLMLAPSLVTNIWQATRGGKFGKILFRLWSFYLTATLTVWFGGMVLLRVKFELLSALLGGLLVIYAILSLSGFNFNTKKKHESWLGVLMGSINGILTGMTGSFVVPGVFYLQSIGLRRDMLIQSMGILFTASTLALIFSLQSNEFITSELCIWSSISIAPAIFGMVIGQRIRQWLTERAFRNIFLFSLFTIGTYIIITEFQNYSKMNF